MKPRKSHKILTVAIGLTVSGLISFAFQNCTRAKFLVDPLAKSEALGKENVFGNQPGDDSSVPGGRPPGDDSSIPVGQLPGDDSSMPGGQPPGDDSSMPGGRPPGTGGGSGGVGGMPPGMPGMPPGNDPSIPGQTPGGNDPMKNPTSSNLSLNFIFECSNGHSEATGGNLLTASAVKIVITNISQKVVCEIPGDFKTEILNTKKLTFMPCSGLAPGRYDAHILDTKNAASTFKTKDLARNGIDFTVNADGTYSVQTKKVKLLYDLNTKNSLYASLNERFGNLSTAPAQEKCDIRVSPLVVSMNSQARGIKLTAPLDGIQFDILGQNSFPMAHDKKQISWFTPEANEYYFIVLPNQDGKVLGIDQMFGDNTRGPDGRFSANGYAALAKHDSDKDNMITDEDEVYEDLRLWMDSNRDGVGDANELFTLREKRVTLIDLHYDSRYQEEDQYGNQTLMKSVIKTEDGKLHLLFDLWFRYLNITL